MADGEAEAEAEAEKAELGLRPPLPEPDILRMRSGEGVEKDPRDGERAVIEGEAEAVDGDRWSFEADEVCADDEGCRWAGLGGMTSSASSFEILAKGGP